MAVVLLNGAPRSGKSSLATALQGRLPGVWLCFGVDAFMAMTPQHRLPGIGLRPGSSDEDAIRFRQACYRAWASAVLAICAEGFNVVADVGIYEPELWEEILVRFQGVGILSVGLKCPVEEIVRRREATGWAPPHEEGALRWHDAIHQGKSYDLEIDTSALTPDQAAEIIYRRLGG